MKRKKSLRGSYTVEAAFLIPMAFGLVLFLVSCAWVLHDRVSACAWVHETAAWEGFQKREEESRESSVKLLITKAEELVEQRGKEVVAVCRGNEWFLPSFVKSLFVLETFHVEESEHIRRGYGEEAVRLRGFLEGVYERWK